MIAELLKDLPRKALRSTKIKEGFMRLLIDVFIELIVYNTIKGFALINTDK